jgi:enediyne biosynthesis protein E4
MMRGVPRLVAVIVTLGAVALVGGAVLGASLLGSGATGRGGALGAPRFVDETAASGVDHTYDGPYPNAVGGGLAVFDCDLDGRPDLYIGGGSEPAALYRNVSPVGGALRFEPVADPATALTAVQGAYPLDIDGDGNGDLAVLREGGNVLLRGLGGCRFESANTALGFDGGDALTEAFSATWEGSNALPTLAFGNYIADATDPDPEDRCAPNALVRPAPAGDRYDEPVALTPAWCALSILFSDWDRSGRRDLRISNDRHYYSDTSGGQEQLWRVAPGEAPRLYTADDGWVPLRLWGMGIGSQDVTGDGYPDVYLTSQGSNALQTLASGAASPAYRNIALPMGLEATSPSVGGDPLPSTSWHAEWADVNADGFADLFVSKGNVDEQPEMAAMDPSDLFLGRADGSFQQVNEAAGIVSFAKGRGASLADLNLDGLPDLIVVNYKDPVILWRNVGTGSADAPGAMGHWLGLRVVQPGPNRDAVGAWVEVRTGDVVQHREITVGGGHTSGTLGPIHIGLGPATEAEVRVTWPDGEIGPWQTVAADRFFEIDRGAGEPHPWPSPS